MRPAWSVWTGWYLISVLGWLITQGPLHCLNWRQTWTVEKCFPFARQYDIESKIRMKMHDLGCLDDDGMHLVTPVSFGMLEDTIMANNSACNVSKWRPLTVWGHIIPPLELVGGTESARVIRLWKVYEPPNQGLKVIKYMVLPFTASWVRSMIRMPKSEKFPGGHSYEWLLSLRLQVTWLVNKHWRSTARPASSCCEPCFWGTSWFEPRPKNISSSCAWFNSAKMPVSRQSPNKEQETWLNYTVSNELNSKFSMKVILSTQRWCITSGDVTGTIICWRCTFASTLVCRPRHHDNNLVWK